MNIVILIGRLTKDVEVKYTSVTQMAVAQFNMAIDRYNDGTDFPRVTAFGKTAENLARYCHKGSKIAIQGRVQTGSYEKDGKKHFTQDIIANNVEFLDSKKSEEFEEPGQDSSHEDIPQFQAIDEDVPF